MQSAAEYQRSLDRFLLARGRSATLQRIAGGSTMSATLLIFKRDLSAQEIVPGSEVTQEDSLVIVSATDLQMSGWIGGEPRRGDRIVIDGAAKAVLMVAKRPMATGFNITVRG
jgi:hypothetical protein